MAWETGTRVEVKRSGKWLPGVVLGVGREVNSPVVDVQLDQPDKSVREVWVYDRSECIRLLSNENAMEGGSGSAGNQGIA